MAFYVKTKVELKFGENAGFNEILSELVPFLGKHGWKLLYGLQTIVGDLSENMHLWEVEDLADVASGMNAAFTDEVMGKTLTRLPQFMHNETVQIMVKTPYSP